MAILWGEIIFPAVVPVVLAAASQEGEMSMFAAIPACNFPKRILEEVSLDDQLNIVLPFEYDDIRFDIEEWCTTRYECVSFFVLQFQMDFTENTSRFFMEILFPQKWISS